MVPGISPGNFRVGGQDLVRAGFMTPNFLPGPGGPDMARVTQLTQQLNEITALERAKSAPEIQRLELTGSIDQIAHDLRASVSQVQAEISRAITSTTSGFPIRENLEAPAHILVPTETPLRNLLPRTVGSGTASAWRQITSLGGGYGFLTQVSSGAASATQTVASTAGMRVADVLQFTTAAGVSIGTRTISSIPSATSVVLTATVTTTTGDIVANTSRPVGAGTGVQAHARAFFPETGCPAVHDTVWAAKSAAYKLLGAISGVTGFAIAAGMTYGDAYAQLKRNLLLTVMLLEENALINGSSTSVSPPWGDGASALGFDGMLNLVTTANGTPAHQVQTAVGPLNLTFIDRMLAYLFEQGGTGKYMIVSPDVVLSITHLAEAAGSIIRVQATTTADAVLGMQVTGYKDSITGEIVPIYTSRFLAGAEPGTSQTTGTMLFGCKFLPDGSPAADVSVLPQMPLPQLNVNESIQGYAAQDLAPTITDGCQVYNSLVTLYSVLRLKSAAHFAKATGLSPV